MLGLAAKLRALLAPTVEALGYELVEAEFSGGSSHALLRIYIDSPRGINVDDCAAVSRQVSAVLDVEDPIPGHYTLEVSSPGLDRPLAKPEDFQRFSGETVKIKLQRPLNGRRNFSGRLVGMVGENVVLELDDNAHVDLPFADIERARLVPQYK